MDNIGNEDIAKVYQSYPGEIQRKLLILRELIFDVAAKTPGIGELEETLKWGEPSYLAKGGSTVRLGWKAARPDHYAMYFNCNSKLVETFRELYTGSLNFEGNRAIVCHREDAVPLEPLRHCVALALHYHKIKHLPLLGA